MGTPIRGPEFMMRTCWPPKGSARNLPDTQPRLNPQATSHQCQPFRHPKTVTGVPAGSQETRGKPRSGPARRLTAEVVKACAVNPGVATTTWASDLPGRSSKAAARSVKDHRLVSPDPFVRMMPS